VHWLIGGWADHCLGLKQKGQTPAMQTVNGQPDFLLPATLAVEAGRPAPALEPFHASDYFDQLYAYAVALIQKGRAYVCDLKPEEIETTAVRPTGLARTAPSANAPWRRTWTSFTA
jgi:glutaminyl-tRNA synthetase